MKSVVIVSTFLMSLISQTALAAAKFSCATDDDYTKEGYPRTFQVDVDVESRRGTLLDVVDLFETVSKPIAGKIDSEFELGEIKAFRFDSDETLFLTNPPVGERSVFIVGARRIAPNKYEGSLHIMNVYVPITCEPQT